MIEKIKGVCIKEQREYLEAENKAHQELINKGYLPQGRTQDFKKVCVFKIENQHTNDEKKEVYYFENWQEANENLY